MKKMLLALVATAAGLLVPGCASQTPTQTGFLNDYSRLQTTDAHPRDPAWRRADAIAGYDAFMVDEVTYHPVPEAPKLSAEKTAQRVAEYRERLITAFSDRYRLVDTAGPGVLRIRAAITNTDDVVPLLNALTMAAAGLPVTSGGISTEAEVVDSTTGERLAAYTGYNNGNRGFLGGPAGFLVPGEQARIALTLQAKALRRLLDNAADNS